MTLPSVQFGGYFLLGVLSGKHDRMKLTPFQQSMFRAGHAHAGVLVILAIISQLLADIASLPEVLEWTVRLGFPLSALLISGGFFAAASGKGTTRPTKMIRILYAGVVLLAAALLILGIGLLV
jgi:hypothetical protein